MGLLPVTKPTTQPPLTMESCCQQDFQTQTSTMHKQSTQYLYCHAAIAYNINSIKYACRSMTVVSRKCYAGKWYQEKLIVASRNSMERIYVIAYRVKASFSLVWHKQL